MNEKKKVVPTFDAFNGASKEMVDLISHLCSINSSLNIAETTTCVEFEECPDKEFTVRCYDGIGVGMSDVSDDGSSCYVIVRYPNRVDLTKDMLIECLNYRGYPFIRLSDDSVAEYQSLVDFGDIMMKFGKLSLIHHIK
jgi:hypothetical protein